MSSVAPDMPTHRDSNLIKIFLFVLFALLLIYAIYEGWGMLYGPAIEVPAQVTSVEPYVLVKGRADRITELRLNGAIIAVTESGEFETPYLLAQGSNRLIFEAHDARGRTTVEEVDVLYLPQEGTAPLLPSPIPAEG